MGIQYPAHMAPNICGYSISNIYNIYNKQFKKGFAPFLFFILIIIHFIILVKKNDYH